MFDAIKQALEKLLAYEGDLDVVEICTLAEQVEALKIRAFRAYERSDAWRAEGFRSAAAAVRAKTRMSEGSARRALDLGRTLESLPETAEAFAQGEISRQHAHAIADACTAERIEELQGVEEQLVEIGRHVKPNELRAVVKRLTDALDGDGGAADDRKQYMRRRLNVSPTIDGLVMIDGVLDPVAGEIVMTALDAVMEQTRCAGDSRSRAQQRADALAELCRRPLDNGELGTSRGVRPHLSVVVDIEELAGNSTELVAKARADAAHIGHLSASTIEWISCDCDVHRIVMAGASEVLDVGRASRTATPAQYKALVAHDGGCGVPGCECKPAWCDVHHLIAWIKGGRTDLANLILLCWRHHREYHLGVIQL